METGKNVLLHFKRLCIKRLISYTRLDKMPIVNRRSLFEGEEINIISQRSFPLREETTRFLRYVCKSRKIPLSLSSQTDICKKTSFPDSFNSLLNPFACISNLVAMVKWLDEANP